jgi:hypothetical protein
MHSHDEDKELFHKVSSSKRRNRISQDSDDNGSDDSSIPYPSDVTDDEKEDETARSSKDSMSGPVESLMTCTDVPSFLTGLTLQHDVNTNGDVNSYDDGQKRSRILEDLVAIQKKFSFVSSEK